MSGKDIPSLTVTKERWQVNGRFHWRGGFRTRLYVSVVLLFFFQHIACSRKALPFEPTDQLGIDNKWIYDSLRLYYYWSDEMKGNPDYTQPTPAFFSQLLSNKDRFSWVSNRRDIGPVGSTADIFGFHYSLVTHPFDPQQLVGVISLVIPGSDADRLGLKRGLFFSKVNGLALTPTALPSLVDLLNTRESADLQLAVLNKEGTALTDSGAVRINPAQVPPKSIYGSHVFEKNGVKTGYLAYYQCVEGYDDQLLEKIQKFREAGIDELILDLRFNPGGSVASVAKLAAVLTPAFNPDQAFVIFKGNKHGGVVHQSFRRSISFSSNAIGRDMDELKKINLQLKRVFVLTSHATISAAELLCNNLPTFLPTIRIGSKTYGKDEASFSIEDKRNPRKVEWIMMPTIYKIFNAANKGDYSNGLEPDHVVNEFAELPLHELGYPGDLAVDKALDIIYGSTFIGYTPLRNKVFPYPDIREQYQSAGSVHTFIEVKRLP